MSNIRRVAIVHDWLVGMRGGEKVLDAIVELYPQAEIFTLIYSPGRVSPTLTVPKKHTSLLQRIPSIEKRYRHFLPVFPNLIERFDMSEFDLVLSSSHCVAKGIRKRPDAVHVSYVHAPMRYVWERYDDYFGPGRAAPWTRLAARLVRARLQRWDVASSAPERVDAFIANSVYIAEQIRNHYGRDAQVIHPFVDLERFGETQLQNRKPSRNYLMVGAFAPYKRIDLAIDAFNEMRKPLIIVGGGQDEAQLKKRAGPTIEFLGPLSNSAITDLYAKARALIFPGLEDFGITPLEAMASGTPVIAYGKGGALDSVTEKTGLFFEEQTVASLIDAVGRFERDALSLTPEACRARAALFTRERFQKEFSAAVQSAIDLARR